MTSLDEAARQIRTTARDAHAQGQPAWARLLGRWADAIQHHIDHTDHQTLTTVGVFSCPRRTHDRLHRVHPGRD